MPIFQSSRLPFVRSENIARWPRDIPRAQRRIWKDSPKNFSALWRIPPGVEFDNLRIDLPKHFMVIAAISGTIQLQHGARKVRIIQGGAAAVSVGEVLVEIPSIRRGEYVFMVHFFRRMPKLSDLWGESVLEHLNARRKCAPGIFRYSHAWVLMERSPFEQDWSCDTIELLHRLRHCGLVSTVQFVGSGALKHQPQQITYAAPRRDAV